MVELLSLVSSFVIIATLLWLWAGFNHTVIACWASELTSDGLPSRSRASIILLEKQIFFFRKRKMKFSGDIGLRNLLMNSSEYVGVIAPWLQGSELQPQLKGWIIY